MNRKFAVGDFVENNNGDIGVVGWIENKHIDVAVEDGYLGIDLLTGSRGFQACIHEDKCKKSSLKGLCEKLYAETVDAEKRLSECNINRQLLDRLTKENVLLKQLLAVYITKEDKP